MTIARVRVGVRLGVRLGFWDSERSRMLLLPLFSFRSLFVSRTLCFGLRDNPWLQSDAHAVNREFREQTEWCRGYFQDPLRSFFEQ